ncbi:ribose-5-phosphate isomerase RKI1 [Sugiyamaella lignohabitans]|uniref:Ribose-5-phosphate isomerase n=1 Tax=Sugiyamaella lignohabitans TaxID=796027 RepID=A0A167BXC1_9ASCO|nr:ribose-5-phosphate isomerase RKI1 [Sugiyamaella lignohabitans]ANB10943.1 ribose-5-phosphate isomerase RKI1 [Sugiyamaella lignohabitans]
MYGRALGLGQGGGGARAPLSRIGRTPAGLVRPGACAASGLVVSRAGGCGEGLGVKDVSSGGKRPSSIQRSLLHRLRPGPSCVFIRSMSLRLGEISLVEKAKRAAAYKAVDEHFPADAKVVGIGSGSTVIYAVERIAQLAELRGIDLSKVTFVPTGFQSKQLIIGAGLNVASIDQFSVGDLDIVIDGADEVDDSLNCIKGGGACLFQEKLVGQCARKFVIVADSSKKSHKLGSKWIQGVPIEVIPMAYPKVEADLLRLGAKQITLRQGGKAKAGPVVTDNGNFILDTHFGSIEPSEVRNLDIKIKLLVGVVETGLFDYGAVAYFGETDGTASTFTRPE